MSSRLLAVVVVSGALFGCAHATYHAPAPTVANNGVALSVVSGQHCFVTRDDEKLPPPNNDNRVHVRVTVQIENNSSQVVGVESEQLRLTSLAGGSGTRTPIAPLGGTDVSVPPGQSEILPLDFAGPGPIDCRQPFDLDPANAVTVDDQPVTLAPVRLVSAR